MNLFILIVYFTEMPTEFAVQLRPFYLKQLIKIVLL